MAGLAEMLQKDGPPPGGPAPDDAGASPAGGKMDPQHAIAVMQRFKITPDDLPLVAAAVEALMPDDEASEPEGDAGGAPPAGQPSA